MDILSVLFVAVLIGAPILAMMSEGGPKAWESPLVMIFGAVMMYLAYSSFQSGFFNQLGSSGGFSPGWDYRDDPRYQ